MTAILKLKHSLPLLILTFVISAPTYCHAQFPNPILRGPGDGTTTYVPSSSTLPIYLNYFRRDVGVTDAYHTFIRPERRLQRAMKAQQNTLNMLERQQRANSQAIQQFGAVTPFNNQVRPTGNGAGFFNYSHYYPNAAK